MINRKMALVPVSPVFTIEVAGITNVDEIEQEAEIHCVSGGCDRKCKAFAVCLTKLQYTRFEQPGALLNNKE